MRGWCEAGFDPDSFWRATPRSYKAALGGVGDRWIRDHDARLFVGFWTARWHRETDMTPLSEVQSGGAKPAPEVPQSPEQIQRSLDAWVIATGGTLGKGKRRRKRASVAKGVGDGQGQAKHDQDVDCP